MIAIEVRAAARLVLIHLRGSWPDGDADVLIFQCWDCARTENKLDLIALGVDDRESELAIGFRVLMNYLNEIWERARNERDVRDATQDLATNII